MYAVKKAIESWRSLWKREVEHSLSGLESSQGNVPRDDGLLADATDSEDEAAILELVPPQYVSNHESLQRQVLPSTQY